MKAAVTEDEFLASLRHNERTAFIELYDVYFPVLARYILQHGGTKEDAEDSFQETVLVLIRNLRKENFQLNGSLKTYVYAINKNIWLKKIRDRKINADIESYEEILSEEDVHVIEEYRLQEQQREGWVKELINKVSQHCIVLITRIFFKNNDSEELIKELGYRNNHSFNNQKYKCLTQLRREGKKVYPNG
ncbi:MAG: polymerase sigma factor, sigma-70 family [Chitinophagaceae bacterium]|nr:polymerase sigma factor, sigma-70 family [Chitinophagaceae bacterium]